jgi:hypothetical protein
VRALAVPLATLAISGCGGGGDGPDPEPSAPTESATPTIDPIGLARDFPDTPREYAEVTVGAWAAPDLLRLADLATPEAYTEIVEMPGPPNLSWTFVACADDQQPTGQSDCSFYNVDGDYLVLTVEHELLGEERAVTGVELDPTSYPDDEVAYVETFVAAWQTGNQARMLHLAVADAVEAYAELPPPEPTTEVEYETGESTDAETEVLVTIDGGDPAEVSFSVNTTLLGEAQAIRAATLDLDLD